MIKFFRKIRQQLLTENKFSKYLLYAIGEIILVVIGILIALSINNWNQNRQNAKIEKRFLHDLLSDIELDIKNLEKTTERTGKSAEAKNYILRFIDGQNISRDSVFGYMGELTPFNKFIPTTVTIDEMKNSYGLEVIRSVSLRRKVVNLYHHYSVVKEIEKDFNNSQERIKSIKIKISQRPHRVITGVEELKILKN